MNGIYSYEDSRVIMFTVPTGPLATNSTFCINKANNKTIIFDSGHQAELSLEIIRNNKLEVENIFFTHTHFDHMAAAKKIQDEFGGKIIIHKDDQPVYDHFETSCQMYGFDYGDTNPVNEYFKIGEEIGFIDESPVKFKVIPTPGHTPGGVCFYTEDTDTPILIAGDTLFQGSIGRTDLPGGNYEQLISSIKNNLFILPENTVVICGHGPTTTIGNEKTYNPFLK